MSANEFIPNDGFPVDKPLTIKLSIETALREEKLTRFKSDVNKIQAKLKQAEFELVNGHYVVTEFCRDLKTDYLVTRQKESRVKRLKLNVSDSNYLNFLFESLYLTDFI